MTTERFTLYIDGEVLAWARERAAKEGRTASKQIERELRDLMDAPKMQAMMQELQTKISDARHGTDEMTTHQPRQAASSRFCPTRRYALAAWSRQ